MKRAGKIAVYFLIAFFFLSGIFHDSILSYFFKSIVQEKSRGKIALTVESFHLGLHFGTVAIYKPVLLFEDLYVDKNRSIKIEKISFDRVKIEGIDLYSIIFKKEIVAEHFFIDKPEFWLVENGTESKSKVQPEGFVNALKKNNEQFSEFKVSINDVEIHYGSVKLLKDSLPDIDPGKVDFTIHLERFSTLNHTGVNHLFYSDEFKLKLRHLNKMLRSGYDLSIDSIVFSSANRDLIVDGVSYMPSLNRKGENSIGFISRQVVLSDIGLDDIRKMKDVKLKSVLFTDGTFINYVNNKTELSEDTVRNDRVGGLLGVLNSVTVDTVSLNSFDYYNIKNENDTLISASNINFNVTDVELDSSMQTDVIRKIGFEDISLSTGYVNVKEAMPDAAISYNSFTYSNSDRILIVSGLQILSDSLAGVGRIVNLTLPEYRIDGLSVHKLQRNEKQSVSLYLDNPKGDLLMAVSGIKENRKQQKNIFPLDLYFYEFVIRNGNFNIVHDSVGRADIRGLNMCITGMQFPDTINDSFSFESVDVSSAGLTASLKKKKMLFQAGSFSYNSGRLLLNDFRMQQEMPGGETTFKAHKLGFSGFNKERFLRDRELFFDTLFFTNPAIKGNYTYRYADGGNRIEEKSFLDSIVSPVQLSVEAVEIKNGTVNTTVDVNNEAVKLSAEYSFSVGAINVKKGDTLRAAMEGILWKIKVDNLVAGSFKHQLKIGSLVADSYSSELMVKHISVSPDADVNQDTSGVLVKSFTLPLLEVRELDYNLLFWHDSLMCSAILVDSPDIDMMFVDNSFADTLASEKDKLISLDGIRKLGYDTIEIADLQLNVERRGDGKDEFVVVKDFDFRHVKNISGKNSNLIPNLLFSLNEVNYYNRVTNQSLVVGYSYIDRNRNSLYIEKVNSHRVNDDGSNVEDKKGLDFDFDNILLSGIRVEPSLPTRITVHKLEVEDIDLFLVDDKREAGSKNRLEVNPDIVKRFSSVVTLLQLDTALMDDVSFKVNTVDQTETRTLNLDSIGVFVEKIRIDTALANMSRPTIIDQVTIDLKGKTRMSEDSLYEIHSGKLYYNFPDQKIVVDSFYLTPLYEPDEFFLKAGYQTDRIDLFVPRVEVDNINIDELVTKNHLKIDNVNLYNLEAEIYRDKHYAIKPGMYKPLPRNQIMSISRLFTIDSVIVVDSYLKYKELSEKADEPGEVYFDDINISVCNLTNSLKKDEKKDLVVQFNGRIMGEAGVDMNLRFPLNADATSFKLTGKTDNMKLSILNPLTTNLLGIGVIKGTGSVHVNSVVGGDSIAWGSLVFRYKNLRLLPYSRNKERLRSGALSPLLSFMINDLVVKSNNPKFARKPRVGQVYFVRDTRKGVINFIWKGVLSGVSSTLGFNNREQRKVKKEVKRNGLTQNPKLGTEFNSQYRILNFQ